jgi:hypothetical protein
VTSRFNFCRQRQPGRMREGRVHGGPAWSESTVRPQMFRSLSSTIIRRNGSSSRRPSSRWPGRSVRFSRKTILVMSPCDVSVCDSNRLRQPLPQRSGDKIIKRVEGFVSVQGHLVDNLPTYVRGEPMADQLCPICSVRVEANPRYPGYVCRTCCSKALSGDGRALKFYNTSLSGGFSARYADTGVGDPLLHIFSKS